MTARRVAARELLPSYRGGAPARGLRRRLPLATRDALDQGRIRKGDYVLFTAVGAGFTVGANLWRWGY